MLSIGISSVSIDKRVLWMARSVEIKEGKINICSEVYVPRRYDFLENMSYTSLDYSQRSQRLDESKVSSLCLSS